VTANDFRRLALALPEAIESAHMDHPDFRVLGKIFATHGYPEKGWGMVKLTPEQQHYFSKAEPERRRRNQHFGVCSNRIRSER